MDRTIIPLHFCSGSSSRAALAPCRPRPATRLFGHSASQRVFRWPPHFACSSKSQSAIAGLTACETSADKGVDDFGSPPTVGRAPSISDSSISSTWLLKLRGWGKNHQRSLASYSRRPRWTRKNARLSMTSLTGCGKRSALEAASWMERLHGIRANASRRNHTELDAAPDLDDGDPTELGAQYAAIRRRFPGINVLGGCCGTDHRHIERICNACKEAA